MVINNRYQIVDLLGKGGFGKVYRVEDLYEHHKILALKKIRTKSITKSIIDVFKLEFKFLTSLTHPNLVKVYNFDVDKETNELFFTMEYIKGGSLYENCKKSFSWENIENFMVQAARAISYIHSKGIIHYDIKPDNMLVDETGQLKLMDFGFAGTQKDSRIRGTIQFLAPEFILKQKITNRIDFFSLGVSFYYSITGKTPFAGKEKKEILQNTARGKYIPIEELRPDIPHHLAEIINKLMHKNAQCRYSSATEIIERINEVHGKKKFKLFIDKGIRGYFSSGRLIGRKKELQLLSDNALKVFRSRIFFDNKPMFLLGQSGNGKSSILREFRYFIQIKEDIDYFTASFIVNDDKIFQAFEIIIEEMSRLYNLNPADYPEIKFLFDKKDNLDPVTGDNLIVRNMKKKQAENIKNFLTILSHKHKFVLELKNFNNANSASIDLLSQIAEDMRLNPEKEISFYIVATVQSENLESHHHIFFKKEQANIDILQIKPLDLDGTESYIRELLLLKKYPDKHSKFIYDFTAGIPFYINEFFVYMFWKEKLFRKGGNWVQSPNFIEEISQTPEEISYSNYKNLTELEQQILKIFVVIGRPVSFSMFSVFNKICQLDSIEDVMAVVDRLCDIEIIHKIKYSDGFRYYIPERLRLLSIKKDLSDEETERINKLIAEYIEIHMGLNGDTIFALSDYYYRSRNIRKSSQILTMAVNKAFGENDLKLASLNLERLYNIEEDQQKRHNVFIAIIHTLEAQGLYVMVLSRIAKFFLKNKKIRLNNLIDINLLKYKCALKTADFTVLTEAERWLLNSYKYKLVQRESMAELMLWQGNYEENNGSYHKALKKYKKSKAIYRSMKKELQCARFELKMAEALSFLRKNKKAMDLLSVSLPVFEAYSDVRNILRSYLITAGIYYDNNFYNKAERQAVNCIELAREQNILSYEVRGNLFVAEIKMLSLDILKAGQKINYSIKCLKEVNNRLLEAEIYFEASRYSLLTGNIKKAVSNIQKCKEIRSRLNRKIDLAKAFILEAKIQVQIGMDKEAENTLLNVLNLAKNDRIYVYSAACLQLSRFYLKNGNIKAAQKMLKKYLKNKKSNLNLGEMIAYKLLQAEIKEKQQKRDKAFILVKEADSLFQENKELLAGNKILEIKVSILYNRLRSYAGEHKEGIQKLSNIIQFLESHKLSYFKAMVNLTLGKIYFDMHDKYRASSCLRSARAEYLNISPDIKELRITEELLAKAKELDQK